jgi:acyl-coenzyme A synthetase/AMP-(fatty) acid ligase
MIVHDINDWARRDPARPAMVHNGQPLSYGGLARAIEAARRFLRPLGLPAGQTAIILVHNLWHAWVQLLALRSLGLDTVVVRSVEHAEALNLRSVAGVVMRQAGLTVHDLAAPFLADKKIVGVPSDIYGAIESGPLPDATAIESPPGGHILFTSGATGFHKKVRDEGLLGSSKSRSIARHRRFDRDTVLHNFDFPLSAAIGFRFPAAVWHVGGCVVLDQQPELARFDAREITHASLVPRMLASLLKLPEGALIASNRLMLLMVGGTPALATAEAAARRLTDRLLVSFGATELCPAALLSAFRGPEDLLWLPPHEGRVVQVVDDAGRPCPPGVEGELRVLLTELDASAYLDDPETSARFFRDGYFHPGDMAMRREDGRIRLLGRVSDVLNLQGNKIAVEPAEQRLGQLLGIEEVCLFSRLNDEGEDELTVVLRTEREIPEAKLKLVEREFPNFRRVRFRRLAEFPRTELGKIQRFRLRELVFGAS